MFKQVIVALALLGLGSCSSLQEASTASDSTVTQRWNKQALTEAIHFVRNENSTAFLIVQNGQVIADERWLPTETDSQFRELFVHGANEDGDLLEDVASQQKSLIAVLVGISVDKEMLNIEKPVSAYLGSGWTKASPEQEAAITGRNLLEMNSGLSEQFTYDAPPGTKFFYNTPAYAKIKLVLTAATGQTLDDMTRDWLTQPLGMQDTAWRQRPAGLAGPSQNATGLVTTARDLARLGQLILDHGRTIDGRQLISRDQLDQMLKPTGANPSYGRLWWLNGGGRTIDASGKSINASMIPAAPADLIAAQGALDRKLYVVPSMNLIVVRLGPATNSGAEFNHELWTRLMEATTPN